MIKIDGKKIAGEILTELKARQTPKKILAAVLVGDDSASISFLKQKEKAAKELSIDFRLYKFSSDLTSDDLREEVGKIANQKSVGGVIAQLPLPGQVNQHYVLNAVPREKDIDVLGERALGAFYVDRNPVLPPAVGALIEILRIANYESRIGEMSVAVVGRGFLVGKPIALWLLKKVRELYVLGHDSDLGILKQADLVISGAGEAGLIKAEMLKDGAGVVDFGYSYQASSVSGQASGVYGDLDGSDIRNLAFYTPTPGGTGPILVAKLMENFYSLCDLDEK